MPHENNLTCNEVSKQFRLQSHDHIESDKDPPRMLLIYAMVCMHELYIDGFQFQNLPLTYYQMFHLSGHNPYDKVMHFRDTFV